MLPLNQLCVVNGEIKLCELRHAGAPIEAEKKDRSSIGFSTIRKQIQQIFSDERITRSLLIALIVERASFAVIRRSQTIELFDVPSIRRYCK
ncbi:hypothetical protein RB195_007433 [Necator americanus]|uniref:Uncharacterized protein n=1 Tax=Necator americanus TaxID=51031 RepID=A0ABR1BZZ2_NECAM